jgi:hypothetical protein
VLGVAIPVTAISLALFADLTLHDHGHGRRRHCQRPQAPAVQPPATPAPAPPPRKQSLDEALEQLTSKCSNWDKVDKCGPGRFATTMASELPVFEANRLVLEQRWLADLEAARDELPGYGDHIAAYGLGWLRSERALPALRRRLVADRGCDGAFAAHWLLHELDGAPLPSRAANTAWRHRCEPNWPGE